ncbi:mannose-6-phosphate isomerase [Plasmodium gonderi]|uniref:Mannose-6-phosphate isomerase n=1 Tax=Plasmodium gonderi TaxID=77519 RepID=A0A1Y1J932_PLAGO|nr:mannose-6-phosphate isomerase [Plasmodium gonderi]GAW79016.1 mannose-6-phosphate isomerase [Plasmodium gonderi]
MKTRKLCINECIPYVQKYDWGKGKDGMVYEVMKNIVKENYETVKKDIDKLEYIKEYIENGDEKNKSEVLNNNEEEEQGETEKTTSKEEVEEKKNVEKRKRNNGNNNTERKDEQNSKYAELWIGNHEKGPNLVLYKNSFIKIEEFIQIYKMKKKKKGKITKYLYKKIEDTKNKYNNKKSSIKSEDVNNNRNNDGDVKRCSDIEFSSLRNYSLYEKYDITVEDVDKNTLFPYLFKMLSIYKPLSIQIHPNEVQTLYLNTLNPALYKDRIFKTEMCVCINSMSLLCGFMNIFKISFLIMNVKELHDFFLRTDLRVDGGTSGSGEVKSSTEEIDQNVKIDEGKEQDIFHLFDLFQTEKNEHVEELIKTLAHIYIYIISYSLKRGNRQTYDVISVIDNYAECIQKYVFDESFFVGFYKNENFLDQNLNLGNLIKGEKEKLQNGSSGKKNTSEMSGSDEEENEEVLEEELEVRDGEEVNEEEGKQNIENGDEQKRSLENEKDSDLLSANRQIKKQNRGISTEGNMEEEDEDEENDDDKKKNGETKAYPVKKQDLQCAAQLMNRKRIKAFYEHMFKYIIYRTMLAENEVLVKCMNDIETKNEKYKKYMKDKDMGSKNIEELYIDICKKKNYMNIEKDTENFIVNNIFEIFYNVSKFYPNDGGRIFIFILQQLNLKDGDVVYIKPGVIHSYISGHCLECMTNSDLVIRGGLTNKEIDKLNFIKYVNYKNNFPIILEKEFINYNIISYSYYKMKYFKILFIKVRPGETVNFLFSDVTFTSCIVLSTNRTVKIKGKKNDKKKASIKGVKKGTVFFIAPSIVVTMSNFYETEQDGDKEFLLYCATS